jgi:uncharacterized protein
VPTTTPDPPPPSPSPPSAPSATTPRRALLEALGIFGLATLLCAVLWQLRGVVPFIGNNLHALIAAIFLYLPSMLLMRRREDFSRYGLSAKPLGKGLLFFLGGMLIVFPLFAGGFYLYYQTICSPAVRRALPLPGQLRSLCRSWAGSWRRVRWRLPPSFGQLALAQLLVVALPEEYFFRGYLQTRLELVWPSRRRVLGANIGWSLLVASALFALGHLLVDFNALRLAVFFPALVFGWMRQATGSILAGVLFHAASNLISEVLHVLFF